MNTINDHGHSKQYDFHMDGAAFLAFIACERTWWIVLQTLVLGSGIHAVVRHVGANRAATFKRCK